MPKLTIPTTPVPQPRQRTAVIAGRARNYTPAGHPVHTFKAACQLAFWNAYEGRQPLDEPLWVKCLFVLPKPASKARRHSGGHRSRCGVKPDIDNLVKSLLDALTGLAWSNDSRISQIEAAKVYVGSNENPHVEIEFGTFSEMPMAAGGGDEW